MFVTVETIDGATGLPIYAITRMVDLEGKGCHVWYDERGDIRMIESTERVEAICARINLLLEKQQKTARVLIADD